MNLEGGKTLVWERESDRCIIDAVKEVRKRLHTPSGERPDPS